MPAKTTLAIATFLALAALMEYAPLPAKLRLPRTRLAEAVQFGSPKIQPTRIAVAGGHLPPKLPSTRPVPRIADGMPRIVDPSGVMSHFYQALWRTEAKQPGAVTRILHYGDSPVTADLITADARALLQSQFGDAGHGFVLIARPWAWYQHRGVSMRANGWHIAPASQARAHDGFHGLGGVSFEGAAGAGATITLPDAKHTAMEVHYLEQPGGGRFRLSTEGVFIGDVDTAGETKQPGFADFPLPPETRRVTVAVTSGTARLFGWSFTKSAPGVIYHSLGLNGGQVQVVLRYFEPRQWAVELQHEHPDLVVINYGTNESVFPEYIERYYSGELRKVIERVKAAVPTASVLIMSPMDRGERDAAGDIATVPILPRIVELQEQAAAETHCAFFNTFEAMGGAGTMARWYSSQPRLVSADFMHPLPGGAAKVGALLDGALVRGYARFKAEVNGARESASAEAERAK